MTIGRLFISKRTESPQPKETSLGVDMMEQGILSLLSCISSLCTDDLERNAAIAKLSFSFSIYLKPHFCGNLLMLSRNIIYEPTKISVKAGIELDLS